ncbi:SDR family NAD(P)-dependent oxidoreductase [Streptomyces prasinus]|uniref:SDR family NAD(P)-dependent oxidoreductase n=4 Tax=Streptomyces prasinus TaxID=67345 RepID=UPI003AFA290B
MTDEAATSPTERKLRDYLGRVIAELHDTRRQLREAGTQGPEPMAVVAMACHLPGGVRSPEDLWRLLAAGGDGITAFPDDRGWDDTPLAAADGVADATASQGGFLHEASLFDPAFFGINPREALAMDPQQRLILEAAWETVERAGIHPGTLRGSRTGVFVGTNGQGYGNGMQAGLAGTEGYQLTGAATSVLSGRIAYTLGLEGPAVSVDTACSSSLSALHLAMQAIRNGDCSLAFVGGVTVMPHPVGFHEFSRQSGLASDGRSKAFSADADGMGMAEGVAMILVERLTDARAAGHPVLAVVRGSAVNQDGASNGLTAPSGPAQERVIRAALADARLTPDQIDAVEAHGTGTVLGDPIEAQALLATYGRDREQPLLIGSLKSNIGHTQSAAGVAGVIKTVLALRHGMLPRTLHADVPTPHVDWSSGRLELLTEQRPWEPGERPRRAAVSSFGISGTNAHVILEEAPPAATAPPAVRRTGPGVVPLPVSGRTAQALSAQAARLRDFLDGARENSAAPAELVDLAHSLGATRQSHEHRAVVLASTPEDVRAGLRSVEEGTAGPGVLTGAVRPGLTVFLFSGQGAQYTGMGRELYETFPVFADAFDAVCARVDLDRPLRDVVFGDGEALDRTVYAQAGLFAVEVALFRLVESWGVTPDVLVGHSIGELAAAHCAGVLSLDDACALVSARGRLMDALPSGGAMLAVEATEGGLELPEGVDLAALNGPTSVTVSGDADAIAALEEQLRAQGVRVKRLTVSHAFHSHLMEPMQTEFATVAKSLTYHPPTVPIVTTAPGDPAAPDYWIGQIREPVRFADAIASLTEVRVFLELGPDGVLSALVPHLVDDATAIPLLRRDRDDTESALTALAHAHTAGATPDWAAVYAPWTPRRIDLPTYAFQRQRYWPALGGAAALGAVGLRGTRHPLLGAVVTVAGGDGLVFTGRLSRATHPWLADHRVAGTVLVPGTALVELALHAGEQVGCPVVDELVLDTPLVLPERGGVRIQAEVGAPLADGSREIALYSRPDDLTGAVEPDGDWVRHASGVLSAAPADAGTPLAPWSPQDAEPVDLSDFYATAADAGLQYGPLFQGLHAAWRGVDGAVYAEVTLPTPGGAGAPEPGGFGLHPALFDAALHTAALHDPARSVPARGEQSVRLPFSWSGVTLHATGATALRVRLIPAGTDAVSLDLADPEGQPVASVASLVLRAAGAPGGGVRPDTLFRVRWTALPVTDGRVDARPWTVVAGPAELSGLAALSEVPALVAVHAGPVSDTDTDTGIGADEPARVRAAAHRALECVRTWLADARFTDSTLVLLTRGAVPVGAVPADPAGAAVWGLVRSAQTEHPGRFVLLDLDPADGDVPGAGPADTDEPQLALRDGRWHAPRLARAAASAPSGAGATAVHGTVLVTGGTGVLGARVARHLAAEHGVRELLLLSRRGPAAPRADELIAELAGLGAHARAVACDVADREALAAVLTTVPEDRPLTGVVHAAGIVDDGVVTGLTPERIDAVLDAKATSALHLDTLVGDVPLFVLFSSASATFGSAGQAGYAAANAVLDALARRRPGAVSVGWGLWEETSGISAGLDETGRARITRAGGPLTTAEALAILDAVRTGDTPHLVALHLNLPELRKALDGDPAGQAPPLLRGLVTRGTRPGAARAVPGAVSPLGERLTALGEIERAEFLAELVRSEAAGVLGYATTDPVEDHRSFKDLGFDSLTAVELRNRLGAVTGLRLPATLVFDHPSPQALTAHLLPLLTGEDRAAPAPAGRAPRRAAGSDEPIAIVAMSCRYPGGVNSPEDLWRLVAEGSDAIGPFPDNRGWDIGNLYDPAPDASGKSYVLEGGFVRDADRFDPVPFNISPREALAMDPQQRLLLEAAWEVFERAGIDPTSQRGSRTGVFAGLMYHDYGSTMTVLPEGVEGYLGTGTSGSVLAGRVSYTFGLEGPAMTVDTACSSSLVTLHLACQALRAGECDMALAGGVTVLSTPAVFIDFSTQGALSSDGRCKTFSADADGTGWGEGVGVLLVERLSDALARGHEVLAVVRGSAVNQDGASNGLTAPNGPSQERVIRQALENARLSPVDIDAVEAHGTGTTLGDPIEAQALLATYGQDREEPLYLGSLKSNIGHTQAAAGVGGVIKMVQAMRHGVLPATLHVGEPTPHVDWEAGSVELLTESRQWPGGEEPRRAGVSSFGVSGTNAHVILEEYRPAEPATDETPAAPAGTEALSAPAPWLLSGKSAGALQTAAARLAGLTDEGDPADVAWRLLTGRAVLEHRAVVVGEDRAGALRALARDVPHPGVVRGVARSGGAPVWVFPGQGSQWLGMGRELAAWSPVFRQGLQECAAALEPYVDWDWSLEEVLDSDDQTLWDRVDVVQPVLWALMVSLARLWRSCGVTPSAVVGHSQGEIAAAVVAGGLTLTDGARVVALRSRALRALAGRGGMVSLATGPAVAEELVAGFGGRVSVAAVNGPDSTVVSGEPDALDELMTVCEERGVRARRVPVDYASHSAQVEELREQILTDLAPIRPVSSGVALYSSVTGGRIDTAVMDADYWYQNLRSLVRFDQATNALLTDGRSVFLECSPHPVLTPGIEQTLEKAGQPGLTLATLQRDHGNATRWLTALAEAHVAGIPVDWTTVLEDRTGRAVDLPTYAFQRERFWPEKRALPADVSAVGLGRADHPMLGASVPMAGSDGVLLTGRIATDTHPWIADHVLLGTVLLPGTALVELALRAGESAGFPHLDELTLEAPLTLPGDGAVVLQVAVGDGTSADDGRAVTVYSRAEGDEGPWTRHATGTLRATPAGSAPEPVPWPPRDAEPVDPAGFYAAVAEGGYGYGPAFQGLRAVWRRADEVFAEIALPREARTDSAGFGLHPALFDAALHAAGAGRLFPDTGEVRVPFAWQGVTVHAAGATELRVRISRSAARGSLRLDAADTSGTPVVQVETLEFRPVSAAQLASAQGPRDALFAVEWNPAAAGPAPVSWAVVGADGLGAADRLAEETYAVEWHADTAALTESIDAGMTVPEIVLLSGPTETAGTPGTPGTAEDVHHRVTEVLAAARTLLADRRFDGSRIVLLTSGAVAVHHGEDITDLPGAAARGLLRTAHSEHPGRFAAVDSDGSLGGLTEALLPGEPETALRKGTPYVPRLVRAGSADAPASPALPSGTVLITGGTGGLGALVARHLAATHGVTDLLLLSRSGPRAPGAAALTDDLAALGARAEVVACDTADRDRLAQVLAGRRIGTVVHAAGVLDDGVLTSMTPERVATVLRPKADAALHLTELAEAEKFVFFSSASGTFGAAGQANYAAANAVLDALAVRLRAQGRTALSIGWGMWATATGMTGHLSDDVRGRATGDGTALSDTDGVALLDTALTTDRPHLVAARLDLATLRARAGGVPVPPLLHALVPQPARRAAEAGEDAASFTTRLAALDPAGRRQAVLDLVRGHAATVLGHTSAEAVEPEQGFTDLGFSSLTAVEIRNRLNAATGLRLPTTLIFDHPNAARLADHLLEHLAVEDTGTGPAALLAGLDRLDTALAGTGPGDETRARVVSRLHALLARYDAGDDADAVGAVTDLDTAGDEELFAFIDNETGA